MVVGATTVGGALVVGGAGLVEAVHRDSCFLVVSRSGGIIIIIKLYLYTTHIHTETYNNLTGGVDRTGRQGIEKIQHNMERGGEKKATPRHNITEHTPRGVRSTDEPVI